MFLDGNVLSLFDGMSCGQIALNRIGIKPHKYYAAEIDPHAIKVTQHNYPNTIQLGSVTEWRSWDIDWSSITLLLGGSPCQGFSAAGKHGGTRAIINGVEIVVNSLPLYHAIKEAGGEFLSQSHLYWVYVEILEHVKKFNPNVKFMLENVRMNKNNLDMITTSLGVEPVYIDSALLCAQTRKRYYWCNWDVVQPRDRGIVLADILEEEPENATFMSEKFKARNAHILRDDLSGKAKSLSAMEYVKNGRQGDYIKTVTFNDRIKDVTEDDRGMRYNKGDKAKSGISELGRILKPGAAYTDALTTSHMPKLALNSDVVNLHYRKLTPIECERLQGVPDGYTSCVSTTQCYKMLGNGWQVDTIEHLFLNMLTHASIQSNLT